MQDWEALLKLDPDNAIALGNLVASMGGKVFDLWLMGRTQDAIDGANSIFRRLPSDDAHRYLTASSLSFGTGFGAVWAADYGDMETSAKWMEAHRRYAATTYERAPKGGFFVRYDPEQTARFEYSIDEAKGEYAKMRAGVVASIERMKAIPVASEGQRRRLHPLLALANSAAAMSCIYLKDYAAAEPYGREALRVQLSLPVQNLDDEQTVAYYQIILAIALAREGKLVEARSTLEPALVLYRKLMARGTEDLTVHQSWAMALYASALANPAQAAALLTEAQRVLAPLPPGMTKRHTVTVLRDWIAEEKAKRS